jgi:hypothetical protein
VVTDTNAWAANAKQLSATNSFTVVVKAVHSGPVLSLSQTNWTVNELTQLLVTNTASDTDVPALALGYALVNPPAGASIDTNGVIAWTPDESQVPATNLITTVVTDSGTPALSATNSFGVAVRAVPNPPSITSLDYANNLAVITWTSSAGNSYRVQYVDDLTDTNWTDLEPDIPASGPSATATVPTGLLPQRFFRLLLVAP